MIIWRNWNEIYADGNGYREIYERHERFYNKNNNNNKSYL